jgi:lipoprotein-releasing system ATP-binding protein
MSDRSGGRAARPVILSLKGLHRSYKSGDETLHVLNGVDLDVRAGEIVGLIGPSGSGKSSLLHAAGCWRSPTPAASW